MRLRAGRPIRLDIDGDEPLRIAHADVMLEAATTSFQVHLQVPAELAVRFYNASLLASAPILAACDELAVPLRPPALARDPRAALRAGGRDRRLRERRRSGVASPSATAGCARASSSTSTTCSRTSRCSCRTRATSSPERFPHLRFHNGTIWHWNRPLIGFDRRRHAARADRAPRAARRAEPARHGGERGALRRARERTRHALATARSATCPFADARANFSPPRATGSMRRSAGSTAGRVRCARCCSTSCCRSPGRGSPSRAWMPARSRAGSASSSSACARGARDRSGSGAAIERRGRDFQRMLADYLEHQRSGAPVHEWPA